MGKQAVVFGGDGFFAREYMRELIRLDERRKAQRIETLQLRPFVANTITQDMNNRPIKKRLDFLSNAISNDDFVIGRYLHAMQENHKKYGRISPFDAQLLTVMKRFDIPAKQAKIDTFTRVTDELGIKVEPYKIDKSWKDAVPAAPSDRRYNPDSGLWEHFDKIKNNWIPDETTTKP